MYDYYYYDDYYTYSDVYYSYYDYYYDFYQNYDYTTYYSYIDDDYRPDLSNEHVYYGFYGVYGDASLPSTYEYNFDGDYASIYDSAYKSNYTAAHENVDVTHFVFQADEFIAMGAAIS